MSDAGGRPHRSLSLDEARSLLVLYNIEDHEDVMRALEPLRKAKKDIKTCVYVPSGGADIPFDDSNIPVHIKNDLNAWGFPSDSVLEKVGAQGGYPDRYHPAGLLCLAIHRSPASIRLQGRD